MRGVFYLLVSVSLCVGATVAKAEEAAPKGAEQAQAPGDIVVTGVADPQSAAATGLKLTLPETPQSVTIIDQQRIRDFQLTNANNVDNVTNTKYLNSLMWGQAFYAAPRSVRATFSFTY